MSAAVIGRQLRQKKDDGKTALALAPQPKPRTRTPSQHQPIPQRPYSPAQAGGGGGDQRVNVVSGAQVYSHHFASPLDRDSRDTNKRSDASELDDIEAPRLRCTWHCMVIVMKALSGGVILLVAGTIMSIVGFLSESQLAAANATNSNMHAMNNSNTLVPTLPSHSSQASTAGFNATASEGISTMKNLTYAGPVIMGLGGIVILAACVLTFEVRDTLGIKVVPIKQGPIPIMNPISALIKPPPEPRLSTSTSIAMGPMSGRKATLASLTGLSNKRTQVLGAAEGNPNPIATVSHLVKNASKESDSEMRGELAMPKGQLTLPLAIMSDLNLAPSTMPHSGASGSGSGFTKAQLQETILETMLSESIAAAASAAYASAASGAGASAGASSSSRSLLNDVGGGVDWSASGSAAHKVSKGRESMRHSRYTPMPDQSLTSPSIGTTFSHSHSHPSHMSLTNANLESFYLGIPSPQDTECSDPDGCSLNVLARCSCSASPTRSMSIDQLYLDQLTSDRERDAPLSLSYSRRLYEEQRLQQHVLFQQQLLLQQQQQQLALQQRLLFEQQQLNRHHSHHDHHHDHHHAHHAHNISHRRPKTIASVESDGLSSTSSSASSDDLFEQHQHHKSSKYSSKSHRDIVTKVKSRTCLATVNVHHPIRPYDTLSTSASSDQIEMTQPLLPLGDICSTVPTSFVASSLAKIYRGRRTSSNNAIDTQQLRPQASLDSSNSASNTSTITGSNSSTNTVVDRRFPLLALDSDSALQGNGSAHKT